MSKWRLRGYVQDSDEEEEDIESLFTKSSRRAEERVVSAPSKSIQHHNVVKHPSPRNEGHNDNEDTRHISLFSDNHEEADKSSRSATPPVASNARYQRLPTESPDPLQCSPPLKAPESRKPLAKSSQILGGPPPFHLELLLNSSESDSELSDAPSLDEPLNEPNTVDSAPNINSAPPTRQVEVKVVIPQYTAIEREYAAQRANRALRTRKPIQLHPYLLEGERYRREFQSRGIKPVAKARSPPRKPSHDGTETQEQEFDPENDTPFNSPPHVFTSTPIIRRQRHNELSGHSNGRPTSNAIRRKVPTSQPSNGHLPPNTKRQKLGRPSTQAPSSVRRLAKDDDDPMNEFTDIGIPNIPNIDDPWVIPRSPPYSSSPPVGGTRSVPRGLARLSVALPLPNLPTPSNSSSIRDELQLLVNSDSESDVETIHRPEKELSRLVLIPSDKSASGSASSDSESAQSEVEVQRAGRKIKGVLPASWLRLDRQAQERRKAIAETRNRLNSLLSPEKGGPQKGVAQRIVNRARSPRATVPRSSRTEDLVVISDESDNEPATSIHDSLSNLQNPGQTASGATTIFDHRYAEDSDNMEDDTLHLFTLGGPSRNRKRQLNITDAFSKSKKKARRSDQDLRISGSSKRKHTPRRLQQKQVGSKRSTHTPPALSILDVDQSLSPSDRNQTLPQFIKLAKRQARRGPDRGRQSPRNKHIRLHTVGDTDDASLTLQQWRTGALKPNESLRQPQFQHEARQPLADCTNNQQRTLQPPSTEKRPLAKNGTLSGSRSRLVSVQKRQHLPLGLAVFHRLHDVPTRPELIPTQPKSHKANLLKPVHRSLRAAQLEGLESDFGRSDRQIAFERGLQRADEQFSLKHLRPSRNPQLARFLANDVSVLPPPSAEDKDIEQDAHSSHQKVSPPKRRLIRKIQTRRIDVDTREYRQPSETTLQDLFQDFAIEEISAQAQSILQGLGPYGTRYSTTFDVSPLAVGTYFHSSTFVGGGELSQALETSKEGKRDLETFAGQHHIHHDSRIVTCGPWNDETCSRIEEMVNGVWNPLDDHTPSDTNIRTTAAASLCDLATILRSLIKYFASRLSFLDAIDRREFTLKLKDMLESLFNKVLKVYLTHDSGRTSMSQVDHQSVRTMTYLLVLSMQVCQVARSSVVDVSTGLGLTVLMTRISKVLVPHFIRKGVPELGDFLERNKGYKERENGIQDEQTLVESLVVCMHVLTTSHTTGPTFWDLVSQELSLRVENATQLKMFESVWASAFTFLPFIEFDASGILVVNRRAAFEGGNWTFIKDLLMRLFVLYPSTFTAHSSSLNEYIRASLTRCYILLQHWNWRRCDPMLNTLFDYFGKIGLKQLRREEGNTSPRFLECLAEQPSLDLGSGENSFHIFLKCVACGISGMKDVYTEKKIRSIVLRITPNNGRSYPKDRPLDRESLNALRNHHDLFCTLYWASPPSCRPKLDIIRSLVHHETSHREACRLSVRAWANLTAFQLSTNEPYASLQPLASWHKEIIQQTLKQYRLAKTEAEDYLNAVQLDGTSDISTHMVRTTIDKNQEQVIATLRDCIAGMHRAIRHSSGLAPMRNFLIDSGIVELLELVQADDRRLTVVIRETLAVLREYAALQKRLSTKYDSQPTSEESQDYGDFPDLDDLEDASQRPPESPSLDFIQIPLWHLLSNAFGAERAPDDNLLMECVDTWVLIAGCQVLSGERSWSYYVDPFSQVSWQQLRHTEQTRKFSPYFMASLITCDTTVYEEHRYDFHTSLLLCLVDRESMLRFQHRLLKAIVQADTSHPLLQNLPFFRDERSGELDISYETLQSRRLALISSVLANMRANLHVMICEDPCRAQEIKRGYAAMLKAFMTTMKSNYQQLRQGSAVTGAYVEFVQKIVQFLKQYTSDISPVLPFFTDSVGFPLPAADPTYVVGRLCGYAPKLANSGVAKQLSVFMQTVAQQSASDNQQTYLVNQLSAALCNSTAPSADAEALRSVLLQGIFPAYIEAGFSSTVGMVIAKPILHSLKSVLETIFFDLRVTDETSVQAVLYSISSIVFAFIRSTECLTSTPDLLKQPHILHTLTLMLESMIPVFPILDYIQVRTSTSPSKPEIVTYLKRLGVFVAEIMHNMTPHAVPMSPTSLSSPIPNAELLAFSARDLNASLNTNWSESHGRIFFGNGQVRREVIVDLGTVEEERVRAVGALECFFGAMICVYEDGEQERGIGGEILV